LSNLTIRPLDHDCIAVIGDLTSASIDKQSVHALPRTKAGGQLTVDLGQVSAADSAALALLIEWLKIARNRKFRLLFRNIPEQLQALARASGFADLLRQSQ